jgi:hypothetical protein
MRGARCVASTSLLTHWADLGGVKLDYVNISCAQEAASRKRRRTAVERYVAEPASAKKETEYIVGAIVRAKTGSLSVKACRPTAYWSWLAGCWL